MAARGDEDKAAIEIQTLCRSAGDHDAGTKDSQGLVAVGVTARLVGKGNDIGCHVQPQPYRKDFFTLPLPAFKACHTSLVLLFLLLPLFHTE
jgi:hypothetical protein